MSDRLADWLDHPRVRIAVGFLVALGLFLNRPAPAPIEDAVHAAPAAAATAVPQGDGLAPPPPAAGWRALSSRGFPPPPPDPGAREKMLDHLQNFLVKLGVKSTRLIDLVVAYADRRPWLDVQAEYEAALKRKDLPAALASVRAALAKVPASNSLLRRDLLEILLRLQMNAWDIAGAETTFREMLIVRTAVEGVWAEELRSNPELVKKYRLSTRAPPKAPESAEITQVFKKLAQRASGGRQPLLYTEEEWQSFEKRMDDLKRQGKLDEHIIGAVEAWHARQGGGGR